MAVMSLCPDALHCESTLSKVFQHPTLHSKVFLNPLYISHPSPQDPDTMECKHGERECLGNVHQLCVLDALSRSQDQSSTYTEGLEFGNRESRQKLWWSFLECMDSKGLDQIGKEWTVTQCLKEIKGPKWEDGIQECSNSEKGKRLLRESGREVEKKGIR